MNLSKFVIGLLALSLLSCKTEPVHLMIETESFEKKGGWVVDQQAFPKICSGYLMANGMGEPVSDASALIEFPETGTYYAYVSTYNWTSPWYEGMGPGSFQLLVDDKPLQNVLGDLGEEWEWQFAGKVKVKQEARVAIHDLTGFNGRADAVYFSKKKLPPPSDLEESRMFRNKLLGHEEADIAPGADLVVVGAGTAGMTAALTAARLGLKVTLINNRPVLGGNNSPEVGVGSNGLMNQNLYPKLGDIFRELSGIPIPVDPAKEPYYLMSKGHGKTIKLGSDKETSALRMKIFSEEEYIALYVNTHVFEVEKEGDNIISVRGKNIETGRETIFKGRLFADCTGDGDVGYYAGADFHIGREPRSFANESLAPEEADQFKMGTTLGWRAEDSGSSCSFPTLEEMPWAAQCSDDYFIDRTGGAWWWETGFELDNAMEAELIRDNMFRSIYGNWSYLKSHLEKYKNHKLVHMQYVSGKRESRRLLGDVVVNQNDIVDQNEFPDASFTTTWSFDLHYPIKENTEHFPGWEWQSYKGQGTPEVLPYHVPYRALYSRNIDNLFMAGRCMSVTHVALGTVRVMATTAMAGEVVGMAAAISIKNRVSPRGVYENHLDELKGQMKEGSWTKPNYLQSKPFVRNWIPEEKIQNLQE